MGVDGQSAAVDDDGIDTDCLQQHHVFGEFARGAFVAHGIAAVFHDEAAARIALEIGQRLDQHLGLGQVERGIGRGIGGVRFGSHADRVFLGTHFERAA